MQFAKNVLVYIFGLFTFSFCYCFYEGITPKIILVSLFLPSICVSYLLKVFRFDTGILRNSCALTENFEQTTTECSCFILDSVSHTCLQYLLFCTFITMICWMSTEVVLNLVAPLDSAVLSLHFEQINIFWTSSFDSISIVFDLLSVSRRFPELYFLH